MQSKWKKYLLRHSLFTYARDSLLFFVNLFVWEQGRDLKTVAVFNILFLSVHALMFILLLPALKRGRNNAIMKTGIAGLGLVLGLILLLGKDTPTYIYFVGVLMGIFNGMYWLVNHAEALDIASNNNRASFFSFRMAAQGASKLSVPAIGWLMFVLFGNDTAGYNAVFVVSILSLIGAFILTEVATKEESELNLRESVKEFNRTKHFWLFQLNNFLYGVSIRSALAAILLPFLIFQVVETESSLTAIQTAVQVVAIIAAIYFGKHKKNMSYITKLFLFGGLITVTGLTSLLVELNIITYIIYTISFILALNMMNVALGTMSNNYISTIKDSDKHRMEFVALREPATIAGFIAGYVFVYFNPNLGIESLKPLLLFTLAATLLNVGFSVFLWRYVKSKTA